MSKTDQKITGDDKRRNAVVTFGKCRRERIRVKQGGGKWKPTKPRNSNHQKYKLLLKGKNKKMVQTVGKQKELLKKFKEVRNFSIM